MTTLYAVSAASIMFFVGLGLGIILGRQDGKKFKVCFNDTKEEIEQAAMQVRGVHPDWVFLECFRVGYKEGAQWADKTMIEKACEWIKNNWRQYVYQDGDGIVHFGHWESDFRKAMEE